MPISGRCSSRSAPTSPTRPRSGSTATSGPNGRPPRPGLPSPSCPTGSLPARTRPLCRRSATGRSPGTIEVFAQRWLHRLPLPFGLRRGAGRVLVGDLHAPGRGVPHPGVRCSPPRPGVFRGADRRQPRHRPPGQCRDHLQPPHPPRHPRRVPHCHRPPCGRPVADRRGRAQPVLQAFADQAVPQRRPGDADRDRRQRPPRPRLQRPPAQPRSAPVQSPRRQPPHTGS